MVNKLPQIIKKENPKYITVKKQQEKEKTTKAGKNFGAFGPQSFKSRSFASFQKDLEKQ